MQAVLSLLHRATTGARIRRTGYTKRNHRNEQQSEHLVADRPASPEIKSFAGEDDPCKRCGGERAMGRPPEFGPKFTNHY